MALTPLKKWTYPVVTNDPNQLNASRYHEALMLAQTGFYPVSVNKLVHGGIHFDEDVLKNLGIVNDKPSKVYCIADGEVIAYRVNDNYQKVDYGNKVDFFSTGFVLVRHLLEMERIEEAPPATTEGETSTDAATNSSTENSTAPAANVSPSSNTQPTTTTPVQTSPTGTNTNTPTPPTTTGDSSTAGTPPATETAKPKQPGHQLYFYSLYMHLADTKYYEDNPKEPAPAFWEQDIYRVIDKGLDFVEGLNIRKMPDLTEGEILAVLQTGTKVELNLELHSEDYKWYAVTSLQEGYCSIPVLTPYEHEGKKIIGWVFTGTRKQLTESTFDIKGKDSQLAKSKGLRVRDESKKNILTMLPEGTQIKITGDKKPKTYVELTQIIGNGQPTIPLPTEKKLVWYDSLENIARGKEYNKVVVLDKPFPINAGDLVGHIGHNRNEIIDIIDKKTDKDGNYIDIDTIPLGGGIEKSRFRPGLHVECFTCEDLPTFITQTQAEASKVPDEDKTLVGISKGAKLLALPSDSDSTVGECFKGSEIKVLSKESNINWLQIEIQISKSETKTLWIEHNNEIQDKLKEKGNLKDLASTTPAWSKFPLQESELTGSKNEVDMPPLLLNINDKDLMGNDKRAIDEKGTLWLKIEYALDSKNVPIKGWTFIGSEGVKKVSGWEWFDFKQIRETGSLKEFYLNAKQATTRNKDNASLEHYKPTIKETLTILDKQYIQNSNKYATLTQDCFKGIAEKPPLTTALGRLLVHYKSEWYEGLDAEGKRPEWEALNSEMTDDVENYLGYIKDGDEAKRDAYVSKFDASEQESIKQGLEQQRRDYERFPADYKDAADKKLTPEQLNLLGKIKELEEKSELWEKTKEKATKMLWWDDVVEELAKQSQQTEQSDTETEKDKTEDSSKQQTETSSTPATLSQNGEVWFMHPVALMNYFKFKAGIVTYHIYQDGKIEKHIPEKISPGFERKYQYVYHDKHKNEHEVCIVDWHTTKKKKNGVTVSEPNRNDANILEYKENVNEGDTQKRVKYKNGDIAEYGRHPSEGLIWRKYVALDEEIEIVRMPDEINYVKGNIIIKYQFSNTKRRYTGPAPFAGFIGALAEVGFELTTTGSCFYEASCFPSSEHVNGKSIDTLYLNDDDEQKFINAMHKFNFNKQITGKNKKKFDNATQETKGTLHDSHLHSGFDDSSVKEIK